MARYDFIAMPVVDDDGGLVGIVTHDDVIDVVRQEATEDLQRQAGVGPIGEGYLEASFVKVWRNRAFWLSCCSWPSWSRSRPCRSSRTRSTGSWSWPVRPAVHLDRGELGRQAATLITRAMALGEITLRDWGRVLRHELLMGLALGLTLGGIGLLRVLLVPGHMLVHEGSGVARWDLMVVVGMAVMAICMVGTLIGSMLPLAFRRVGVDPALASSPFVATFVDVTGIVVYFAIASAFLL